MSMDYGMIIGLSIIGGVVIVFIIATYWAVRYKEKKYNYEYDPSEARPGLLGTRNGVGFTYIGSFRKKELSNGLHVSYHCFQFLIIFIPIACYKVWEGNTTKTESFGDSTRYETEYKIYGTTKWRLKEIVIIIIPQIIIWNLFLFVF